MCKCVILNGTMQKEGIAMEESWKCGLRISWYLLGPLLLYALVNECMILFWTRLTESASAHPGRIPASVPAAAAGAFVLWVWYRKQNEGRRKARLSWTQCLGIIAAAAVSCILLNHLLVFLGISSEGYDKVKGMVFELDLIWQIAGSGILIPLAEELVFRGLGYQRLRREMNALPAAVITAMLFALYHGNLIQGIYAFLMGLLLTFVCEIYGSLSAAWLFHAAANFTAILLTVI